MKSSHLSAGRQGFWPCIRFATTSLSRHVTREQRGQGSEKWEEGFSPHLLRQLADRNDIGLVIFLILSYIVLILTVSRSAWLGAFAVTFIFLFTVFTQNCRI